MNTPRIPVVGIPLSKSGLVDVYAIEPPALRARSAVQRRCIDALERVDPLLVEVARLRNAHKQQCRH